MVEDVYIKALEDKYYSTELVVKFGKGDYITISISGNSKTPSTREIGRGWQVEDGMDHVEGDTSYKCAQLIKRVFEAMGDL
jgi:hypothetical protein